MAMNTILFPLVLVLLLSRSNSAKVVNFTEYDYKERSSKGPDHWGELRPEWRACGEGNRQSPVDILKKGVTVLSKLGRLERRYKPAAAVLKNRGHDIMVKWNGDAGSIIINETNYYLKQLHWHAPSEHRIDGSRFNLEMHMVHESKTGGVAVVGVLYKFGEPDSFLTKLMHAIKLVGSTEEVDLGGINPKDAKIGGRKYFSYEGSLTSPPCAEGLIWTVMRKVRSASRRQIHALQQAVADGFEVNARPVQPLNGRAIWLYDPSHTGLK